jgi:hypothetical protein
MELTNKNVQLSPKTLILGMSGKRGDVTSVGGFGEGYKVALVVLLRNGVDVVIYNGDKKWTPSFEWSYQFQEDMLTITETDYSGQDLTFSLSGLNKEDIDQAIENCLYLQEDLGHVWYGTRGKVFDGVRGKLYVGGLYVCEIKGAKYSYDFKPQYLPLNRDRKTPEFWDINKNTSELLKEVFPAEDVVDMVLERAADVSYMEYHSNASISEACYNNFVSKYVDAIVAENYEEQEKLKAKGLNAVVLNNSNFETILKRSSSYQNHHLELLDSVEEKEDNDLSPIEMFGLGGYVGLSIVKDCTPGRDKVKLLVEEFIVAH